MIKRERVEGEYVTNRGVLDLEGHDNPKIMNVMYQQLAGHPDFIERKGAKLYFDFKTHSDKVNFFVSTARHLISQGYRIDEVEEVDKYELRHLKEIKKLQKKRGRKLLKKYEKVVR